MQKFYDYYLKNYLHKDFELLFKARLVLNFCLVTAAFSLFYTIIAYLINFQQSLLVMPTIAALYIFYAFLLTTKVDLKIIATLYLLTSYVASLILISFSGGLFSSITPWLTFIPLAGNLLINKKVAIIWLVICVLTNFGLVLTSPEPTEIPYAYDKEYNSLFYAMGYSGLAGIILLLSMIFQNAKDNYANKLKKQNLVISNINKDLSEKNDEILAQNEELLQQREEIVAQREFIEQKNSELLNYQDELNSIIHQLTNTQSILHEKELENRNIINSLYASNLYVVELDSRGYFTKTNSATNKLLRIGDEHIIGKSLRSVAKKINFVQNKNEATIAKWTDLLTGKYGSIESEIEINNTKHWLKEDFFPILTEDGQTERVMIIAQDISKTKKQQAEIFKLNEELKNKISEIASINQALLAQRQEIVKINKELTKTNAEIKSINQNLEERVIERTKNLETQNNQLAEYAFINSHLLRGPLCSILGLVQLMEAVDYDDRSDLLFHMRKSTGELEKVVSKISNAINKGAHFDRKQFLDN